MNSYYFILITLFFLNWNSSPCFGQDNDSAGIVLLSAIQNMKASGDHGLRTFCQSMSSDTLHTLHFNKRGTITAFSRLTKNFECEENKLTTLIERHRCLSPMIDKAKQDINMLIRQHPEMGNTSINIIGQIYSTKGSYYVEQLFAQQKIKNLAKKIYSFFTAPSNLGQDCELGLRIKVIDSYNHQEIFTIEQTDGENSSLAL